MPGISEFKDWQPPEELEVPECYRLKYPDCGFRWLSENVVSGMRGAKGMRQWTPVERLAEDPSPSPDTRVRRGDLFLCMMSKRMIAQRNAYYQEKSRKKREAVEKGGALAAGMSEIHQRYGEKLKIGSDMTGGKGYYVADPDTKQPTDAVEQRNARMETTEKALEAAHDSDLPDLVSETMDEVEQELDRAQESEKS